MRAQRLHALALGYEDLNDHDTLRLDPFLAVAAGKQDPLGQDRLHLDGPALCRMIWNESSSCVRCVWASRRAAVQHGKPDLILMDIFLPQDIKHGASVSVDGFGIMDWLRYIGGAIKRAASSCGFTVPCPSKRSWAKCWRFG